MEDPLAHLLGSGGDHRENHHIDGVGGGFDGSLDGDDEDEDSVNPERLAADLYSACKDNDLKAAQRLLEAETSPDHIDRSTSWTALHWAAFHSNVSMAGLLLEAGAANMYKQAVVALAAAAAAAAAAAEEAAAAAAGAAGGGAGGGGGGAGGGAGGVSHGQVRAGRGAHGMQDRRVMNTPLHWAAFMGNLRIVWMLLHEGYSPNDVDETGNTPTHLAASSGRAEVLDILLLDGGDVHVKNAFKNTPLDVVTGDKCRDLLRDAIRKPAPSREEQQEMHVVNLRRLKAAENDLLCAVEGVDSGEGKSGEGEDGLEDGEAKDGPEHLLHRVEELEAAVARAEDLAICGPLVEAAKEKITCLVLQHRLEGQVARVKEAAPIVTQTKYTRLVNVLEQLLIQAEAKAQDEIPPDLLRTGRRLVSKSSSEYWLNVAFQLNKECECAEERHVRNIDKLDKAVERAFECEAEAQLVSESASLLKRLKSEVEISRRAEQVPEVRLPPVLEDGQKMPKDWWKEEDTGAIDEGYEGFPLPPVNEAGVATEYNWVPSLSLGRLREAHRALTAALADGTEAGANATLLQGGTTHLTQVSKTLKVLEAKDSEDKAKAVTVATKAAKKLKKKGKGKGKKDGG